MFFCCLRRHKRSSGEGILLLTSNNYGVVLDWRPLPAVAVAVAVDDARQRGCRVRPRGLRKIVGSQKGGFAKLGPC
jgi:hypothetical protein